MWIVAAIFSAFFACVTAILSKCGIKNTNSDVATAVRTSVVLVTAWLIVFITGAYYHYLYSASIKQLWGFGIPQTSCGEPKAIFA